MISKIYYTVLVRLLGHWRSELGANTPTCTPYYGIYTVRYECSLYDDWSSEFSDVRNQVLSTENALS